MDFSSIDLSKKEKSFSHWLAEVLRTLDKKSIDDIKEMITKSKEQGVYVSEKYLDNVIKAIDEFNGNKARVLKYLANIMLKGADLGVITSIDLMKVVAGYYDSTDEFIVDFTVKESSLLKNCDLVSNFRQTWEKSNSDFDTFLKRVAPFVQSYLSRRNNVTDINEIRKAITEATDGAVRLVNKNDVWTIAEVQKTEPATV